MDLSKLSDYDLDAISKGRMDLVSDDGLNQLAGSNVQLDDIAVTPQSNPPDEQDAEPTLMQKIGDVFTGNLREVATTEAMPDWASMPELNQLSMASAKTGIGTLLSNPDETAQIIQANFPQTQIRQDEKGNYIFKSSIDGKEYAYKAGFRASDIPRALSGIAAFTPASAVRGVLGSMVAGGATQAGIEATQAGTGGEFNAGDVGMVAGISGAIPAAGQAINVLKNVSTKTPQAIQEVENLGMRVMTSDALPPQNFISKTMQQTGERIPFAGTGGIRTEQFQTGVNLVEDVLKDYGATGTLNATDDVTRSLIAKRGSDLTKYATNKKEVIERLANNGVVPVPNALKAIDDEIARLSKNAGNEQADTVIDNLNKIRNTIQNKDLSAIEVERQILGSLYKDPNLLAAKDLGEKAMNKIYAPLREDMGNFIKANGQRRDFLKWKLSNDRLAQLAGEVENKAIKRVLSDGEVTPEVVGNILFKGNPSAIKALYRQLPPKGKTSAKLAILNEAAKDSAETVGLNATFSPAKFKRNIEKLGDSIGVFFDANEKARIDGIIRAIDLTKRAQQSGVVTNSGQQAVPFIAGSFLTDIFGGMGAATASLATMGGLARLYESAPVRNILISLSKAPKGSDKELQLIKQLSQVTTNFKE
jgi:hypothetical protein